MLRSSLNNSHMDIRRPLTTKYILVTSSHNNTIDFISYEFISSQQLVECYYHTLNHIEFLSEGWQYRLFTSEDYFELHLILLCEKALRHMKLTIDHAKFGRN
jgi:hypothetical protein